VQAWNVREIETPGGTISPVVLDSDDQARVVVIGIEPGQELGDHQVVETAYLAVVDGSIQVEAAGETRDAMEGTLLMFEPRERHVVRSRDGAKVILFLAPWPGEGHYRGEERG
jgi:quercetin dioxygenase-like cupin family protein